MGKELEDALRQFKKRDVETFGAKVVSVDKDNATCVVKDDQLEYTDVRLSSVIDGSDKKFLIIPKVGSSVLVSPINEDLKNLYVEAYSEIEGTEINIQTLKFALNENGMLLKKGNLSFKDILIDLLDAIINSSYTVTTPAGPGNTNLLSNVADFQIIKTKLNQILS